MEKSKIKFPALICQNSIFYQIQQKDMGGSLDVSGDSFA